MLSRGVARALQRQRASPWASLGAWASPGTPPKEAWVGNLEGTLTEGTGARCRKPRSLCLGIARSLLRRLRQSPFVALSLANNHAADFGPRAKRATSAALKRLGIVPLTEKTSPAFLTLGGEEWAFVALNLINRSPTQRQLALERARLQIGLARARTPRVVVLPHWGREYSRYPGLGEERGAAIFRRWGAAVIAGSHAHTIMESRCEGDAAVYFGLGNALFDQYPASLREGLALRCCSHKGGLTCRSARTVIARHFGAISWKGPAPPTSQRSPPQSGSPSPTSQRSSSSPGPVWGKPCHLRASKDSFSPKERQAWRRHPGAGRFVFVQPFRSLGKLTFFALHRSLSTYDNEVALRPYVFRMKKGRHRDLWSGTALGRPLVAARLFPVAGRQLLCALHRGDSFLRLNPKTTRRLVRVYRWTGFGFAGVRHKDAIERCRNY